MATTDIVATVVICTFNRADRLGRAVESVMAQTLPGGRVFEILLIDDGSEDATSEVANGLAERSPVPLRYVRVPHGGVAAARNAGVAHARGTWIAFFDDDQEAEPGWLARLIARAEDTGADCVAGRITVALVDLPHDTRLDPTVGKLLGDNGFMAVGASPQGFGPNVVPGTGNALARRALFDEVGLFDVELAYGEDAEWFRRARRHGARIAFAPDAVIRHLTPPARLTPDYLFSVARRGAASRAADDLKDGGAARLMSASLARMIHLALMAARLVVAHMTGDDAAVLGRACSIRYSLAYMTAAARLATHTVFGSNRADLLLRRLR